MADEPDPTPTPADDQARRVAAVIAEDRRRDLRRSTGAGCLLFVGGLVLITALIMLMLAGCGTASRTTEGSGGRVHALGQGPSQNTGQPTADALCNDLGPNGLSIIQVRQNWQPTGTPFAVELERNLTAGCPDLLKDPTVQDYIARMK